MAELVLITEFYLLNIKILKKIKLSLFSHGIVMLIEI